MNKKIIVILVVVFIIVSSLGGFWYYYFQYQKGTNVDQVNVELDGNIQNIRELKIKDIDTSNWKTYRNKEFGFEVKYPEGWQINTDEIGEIQEFQLSITHCPTVDGTEYCGGAYVSVVDYQNKKQGLLKSYPEWAWTFKKQEDIMPIEKAFIQNIALRGRQKCYDNSMTIKFQINEPIKECLMVGGGAEHPRGLLKPFLGYNYFFKHKQSMYLLEIGTEYHFKSIKRNLKGYSLILGSEYGNNLEMSKMILQSFRFINHTTHN